MVLPPNFCSHTGSSQEKGMDSPAPQTQVLSSRATTADEQKVECDAICPDRLYSVLASGDCLLLDVRSTINYQNAHLSSAMSVSCSTMLQRRLVKGKAKIEDQLCEKDKQRFLESQETALIIVYDEQSTIVPESETHILYVFLSALMSHSKRPLFLSGGFQAFSLKYPSLIERGAAPPSLNLQLQPRPCVSSLSLAMPMRPMTSTAPRQDVVVLASAIQPFLYLGGKSDAESQDFFRHSGVRHVLNVTTDCPNFFEDCPEFTYKTVPIKDTWHQNISAYFNETTAFIDAALAAGGSVLVHCMGGISRSATVIIAYLMMKNRWPLNYTYGFVKSIRPNISPNLDFMGHLLNLEKELGLSMEPDSSGDAVYSPAFVGLSPRSLVLERAQSIAPVY